MNISTRRARLSLQVAGARRVGGAAVLILALLSLAPHVWPGVQEIAPAGAISAWQLLEGYVWESVKAPDLRVGATAPGRRTITAIAEGREGDLFVGTRYETEADGEPFAINGLWCYRGEKFEYVYPYGAPGAPKVLYIAAGAKGWVWVGTEEGLAVLTDTGAFVARGFSYRYRGGSAVAPVGRGDFHYSLGYVRTIVFDGDGEAWMGGQRAATTCSIPPWGVKLQHMWMEDRRIQDDHGGDVVRTLARTRGTQVWGLTERGHLDVVGKAEEQEGTTGQDTVWKRRTALPTDFHAQSVDFLYVDSRSRIWVAATTEHGSRLACYDTQADAWKVCSDSDALIGNSNVEDLTEDSRGCLYFATSGNGIITFDGNTWAQHPVNEYLPHIPPVEIPPDATEETKARLGPWTNGVKIPTSAVFCDREDNLWIGSHVYLMKCPARWEGESPMTGGAGDEGRKE